MRRRPLATACFLGTVLCLTVGLSLTVGCVTRITPVAEVSDPTVVYVVDYGRHSSVLLPVEDGAQSSELLGRTTLREYTFGDWVYYAKDRDSLANAARALFWKTDGSLGRRDLVDLGPASDEAPIEPAARIQRTLQVDRVIPIVVERELAQGLLASLNARFEDGEQNRASIYNPAVDKDFVLDEQYYSILRHCNHEVRDWLRELGLEALGAPLIAEFKVLPAE